MRKSVSLPMWSVVLLTGLALMGVILASVQSVRLNDQTHYTAVQRTAATYYRQLLTDSKPVLTVKDIEELDSLRVQHPVFETGTEQRVLQRYQAMLANLRLMGNPGYGVVGDEAFPMLNYIIKATWQPNTVVTQDDAELALHLMNLYVIEIPYYDEDSLKHLEESRQLLNPNLKRS